MTQEEIFSQVKAVIVDSLNVDEEEITLDSKLAADLGAESIDFLDITFRLERQFGFRIPHNELFPTDIFKDVDDCVKDGKVTPKGIDLLKSKIPFVDFSEWEANPQYNTVTDTFTVNTLVKYIGLQQTIIS
jgi:acyl carrier protein